MFFQAVSDKVRSRRSECTRMKFAERHTATIRLGPENPAFARKRGFESRRCSKKKNTNPSSERFVLFLSGVTGQNYNSIKNRIISYIPRATPPNIVVNIVTIAIILNGCLWINLELRCEYQKSENRNKHSSIICKMIWKSILLSLFILLCGVDGGNQNTLYFQAIA